MSASRLTARYPSKALSGERDIRVNRRFSPVCQSRDMVRSLIAAHYSTL